MFVGYGSMLSCMISSDTVEMIKQFHEDNAYYSSLLFHGDAVYIGSDSFVIRWNVVTDAVLRLEGYPGLILLPFFIPADFHIIY